MIVLNIRLDSFSKILTDFKIFKETIILIAPKKIETKFPVIGNVSKLKTLLYKNVFFKYDFTFTKKAFLVILLSDFGRYRSAKWCYTETDKRYFINVSI